jgi:hypothetical protein
MGAAGRARLGEELTPAALGVILDQTYQSSHAGDGPEVAALATAALVQP